MTITLIAAVAANGVIGGNGTLPWHFPEDLARFKALTIGRTVLMGRRTFESIGKALPGRRNLVVTRQADWTAPGVEVFHSTEEALAVGGDVMVIGGGELYRELMPVADVLELTRVKGIYDGDAFFPPFFRRWTEVAREVQEHFDFVTYRRAVG